ncbi:carbohydrate ABC transporter permease [Lachnoanaerobaculum umeaense]|uniref:Carbohydrate ABC transporter permease n=1 Tax=Lachnoanaerobaculum umeaense TaxID=617123 RepID=A0A385Q324_9FIRM|nr:carbohydrate ABC transporter permease [Lachnoanaerobaculum umeaense]AYB00606.1 carbohydrate ABC transporter permease [Lachnoanaerobaculum umeaense]PZW91977.1 putative aldouronate transport system permease protein [Lachnoanaerobaculum umeaense]
MKRKKSFLSQSTSDKVFTLGGNIFLGLFVFSIIIPIIYIIVASFIDPVTLQNSGISFDFSKWTATAYERVISNKQIWVGFYNAIVYSVVFTVVSVMITLLAAYPMSRPDFRGRKLINIIFVITMFFGGGLIPTYLVISDLGLLNSMWAIILPGAFSVWNMIIARTYYQNIPAELREAAEVDGANEITYFFKILLPVCKPVIAVLVLWQFVVMWNSYFDAMVYLSDEAKQPLQLVLRAILIQNQPQSGMIADIQSTAARAQIGELLKYATIIISSLPLIAMYPFFQKYFDAGIMAGSVKG